jgi:hypothetical protein
VKSSRERGRLTSEYKQLSDSSKNLVMVPRWVPGTKIDWPTDRLSEHNFDFDSVGRFTESDNSWSSVTVSCCCEKLVTETRNRSGSKRKGTSAVGSRYQAVTSEDSNKLRRLSTSYYDL